MLRPLLPSTVKQGNSGEQTGWLRPKLRHENDRASRSRCRKCCEQAGGMLQSSSRKPSCEVQRRKQKTKVQSRLIQIVCQDKREMLRWQLSEQQETPELFPGVSPDSALSSTSLLI